MAITLGVAPSRIFYGWWGAPAPGVIVFHGTFDLTGGYGAAFSVGGGR
jgi:hypothetical protein